MRPTTRQPTGGRARGAAARDDRAAKRAGRGARRSRRAARGAARARGTCGEGPRRELPPLGETQGSLLEELTGLAGAPPASVRAIARRPRPDPARCPPPATNVAAHARRRANAPPWPARGVPRVARRRRPAAATRPTATSCRRRSRKRSGSSRPPRRRPGVGSPRPKRAKPRDDVRGAARALDDAVPGGLGGLPGPRVRARFARRRVRRLGARPRRGRGARRGARRTSSPSWRSAHPEPLRRLRERNPLDEMARTRHSTTRCGGCARSPTKRDPRERSAEEREAARRDIGLGVSRPGSSGSTARKEARSPPRARRDGVLRQGFRSRAAPRSRRAHREPARRDPRSGRAGGGRATPGAQGPDAARASLPPPRRRVLPPAVGALTMPTVLHPEALRIRSRVARGRRAAVLALGMAPTGPSAAASRCAPRPPLGGRCSCCSSCFCRAGVDRGGRRRRSESRASPCWIDRSESMSLVESGESRYARAARFAREKLLAAARSRWQEDLYEFAEAARARWTHGEIGAGRSRRTASPIWAARSSTRSRRARRRRSRSSRCPTAS